MSRVSNSITASDRRILDAVKAAKTSLVEYRVIRREVDRLYHEAESHPDYPETYREFWKRIERGKPQSPMSNEAFRANERARKRCGARSTMMRRQISGRRRGSD